MAKLIFTPWKEQAELLAVRGQFYPPPSQDGPDMRAHACAKIGAWKLRGNLPHSVEATALLTDAILHDDASKNSIFSIRATYSAAFCRFVIGLVDSKLHGQKRTMFQRAIDLGLPASFVELRHEATHRDLPSLVVLRSAAQRSLEWLWDYYWAKLDLPAAGALNVSTFAPSGELGPLKEAIRHSLEEMKRKDEETEPPRKRRKSQHDSVLIAPRLVSICKDHADGAVAISRILLEEEILIPTRRTLGTSLDEVFARWDQLLQMVVENYPAFLSTLTEEMVNKLGAESPSDSKIDSHSEGIFMWLGHIISSETWKASRRHLSFSYILAACQVNPNDWTTRLSEFLQTNSRDSDVPDIEVSLKTKPAAIRDSADLTSDQDSKRALNRYGWEVLDNWNREAIGVV